MNRDLAVGSRDLEIAKFTLPDDSKQSSKKSKTFTMMMSPALKGSSSGFLESKSYKA